jgi:serine/threonine protein kinase
LSAPDPTSRTREELAAALGQDFDILRLLGSGSVATVFLAREKALSRLVAIKVMDRRTAADETTRRRFEREARAAASLSDHPNVAGVHRFGQLPDDSPFIVMRFVKGRTMEERLAAEGRLPLDEALGALRDVTAALVQAHSKGIVHRDLRPNNVLWDEETGRALLTDFGIAALLATGGTEVTRLTAMGELIGDPSHMSPEQLRDEDVTEMSDIYGLGVLGYELLTGDGPYDATTRADRIKAHLTAEPRDLKQLRPDVPVPVADLLRRCLAREPKYRPSAGDVLRVLDAARNPTGLAADAIGAAPIHETPDLQTLLRRKVPQVVLITGAVGYFFTEVVNNFRDAEMLRSSSYPAAWVVMITAVLLSAIIAWFHGEQGRQRAPAVEYVLLGVVGIAGFALSAWIYVTG